MSEEQSQEQSQEIQQQKQQLCKFYSQARKRRFRHLQFQINQLIERVKRQRRTLKAPEETGE